MKSLNQVNNDLPKALEQLSSAADRIKMMADYASRMSCSPNHFTVLESYQAGDKNKTYETTKGYVVNALKVVAYHVKVCTVGLSNLLMLQDKALDDLDLQLKSATHRLRTAHESVAVKSLSEIMSTRRTERMKKAVPLEGDSVPIKAKPLPNYVPRKINLNAFDGVGVCYYKTAVKADNATAQKALQQQQSFSSKPADGLEFGAPMLAPLPSLDLPMSFNDPFANSFSMAPATAPGCM